MWLRGNFKNGDWTADAIEERKWLRSLVRSFTGTETTRWRTRTARWRPWPSSLVVDQSGLSSGVSTQTSRRPIPRTARTGLVETAEAGPRHQFEW